MNYDFILIILTPGGPKAFHEIIDKFDESINLPIIVLQTIPSGYDVIFKQIFEEKAKLPLEIIDKDQKLENKIYLLKSEYSFVISSDKKIKTIGQSDNKMMFCNFIKNIIDNKLRPIIVVFCGLTYREELINQCKIAKASGLPIIVQNIDENPNFLIKYETELSSKIIKEGYYTIISKLNDIPEKIKQLLLNS